MTTRVFISRFGNDSLLGIRRTAPAALLSENFAALLELECYRLTLYRRVLGEYGPETGPGVRFKLNPLLFTVYFLRGAYLW